MKLGYLMIPRARSTDVPTRDTGRAKMAQTLGVSEFYAIAPQDHPAGVNALGACPEQVQALRTLPDVCDTPLPQVVAINGERQLAYRMDDAANLAHPAETAQQVATHAHQRRATLSVSWLNTSDLARHWTAHVSASTHAGLRARPEDWRIARTILVCDDAARAEAAVKSKDSPCRAYYNRTLKPGMDIDAVLDACVLYGSLDTVLDDLHDIQAATGPFGTLTLVDHAWPDEAMARQSLVALTSALSPRSQRVKAPYPSSLGRRLS